MSKLVGHTALLPLQSVWTFSAPGHCPGWCPCLEGSSLLDTQLGVSSSHCSGTLYQNKRKGHSDCVPAARTLGRYWHSNNTQGPSKTLLPAQRLMATSPHVGVPGKLADPTTGLHAGCRSCLPTSRGTLCSGGWGWPLLPPSTQSRW